MSREIFIDTASLEEVVLWHRRGIVDGVTTNQKIFLNEGSVDFKERVCAICDAVPHAPVSVELTEHSAEALAAEALVYAGWRPNVVIKVPMTTDGLGLQVIAALAKVGVQTNATVMMTAAQLILAARAGASYISHFFNRARDAGEDACLEIARTRQFLDAGGYRAKIIAGSIRSPRDVPEAFSAGADIVTIPPKILEAMLDHPKTVETLREFDLAWQAFRRQNDQPLIPLQNGSRTKRLAVRTKKVEVISTSRAD
jgi:transaldolase